MTGNCEDKGMARGKPECREKMIVLHRTSTEPKVQHVHTYIHFSHGPVNPGRPTNRVYMHELNIQPGLTT